MAKKAAKKPTVKTVTKQSYQFGPGSRVPANKVLDSTGAERSLNEFKGRFLVVYFYPKDNTPGCTVEGQDFKRLYRRFQALDCDIVGISRDSVKSHHTFREKFGFPFTLLSDEREQISRAFDVIQMKSLYGRKFEGIERSTFVIARDGKAIKEWRKVRVPGHAEEVLEFVKSLKEV